MSIEPRRRLYLVGSVILGALPVTFALIRAITTGNDLRYFWLAGAALIGSMAVMLIGRDKSRQRRVSVGRGLGAVIAGAAGAITAALLQGGRAGLGVAIVGISFGVCTGLAAVSASLALPTRDDPAK
ncbi:MAG: hypothetical protein ACSLFK_02280 [Gemmatimonadaceae bacterium]